MGTATSPAPGAGDRTARDNKAFISLHAENAPVILLANQAADYHHYFGAFKDAEQAQTVRYEDGVVRFATVTFHGPSRLGQVDGQTVNLAPARGYDSPFIRSDWNSGLIYIRKGDDTEILDFRDPGNPLKTVGSDATSDIPAGDW